MRAAALANHIHKDTAWSLCCCGPMLQLDGACYRRPVWQHLLVRQLHFHQLLGASLSAPLLTKAVITTGYLLPIFTTRHPSIATAGGAAPSSCDQTICDQLPQPYLLRVLSYPPPFNSHNPHTPQWHSPDQPLAGITSPPVILCSLLQTPLSRPPLTPRHSPPLPACAFRCPQPNIPTRINRPRH